MKKQVKDKLLGEYLNLDFHTVATCLKYRYKYHNVNVNVFFDAYDIKSLFFSIILVYKDNYYFTPLNIMNSILTTQYLPQIPVLILDQILVNDHLDDFYQKMEEYLLNNTYTVNFYTKDNLFSKTMKYQKNNIDLPFWWHIRKIRMDDETLEKLSARADISREVLCEIQSKNLTLVRTDKIDRRKKLTMILSSHGIVL